MAINDKIYICLNGNFLEFMTVYQDGYQEVTKTNIVIDDIDFFNYQLDTIIPLVFESDGNIKEIIYIVLNRHPEIDGKIKILKVIKTIIPNSKSFFNYRLYSFDTNRLVDYFKLFNYYNVIRGIKDESNVNMLDTIDGLCLSIFPYNQDEQKFEFDDFSEEEKREFLDLVGDIYGLFGLDGYNLRIIPQIEITEVDVRRPYDAYGSRDFITIIQDNKVNIYSRKNLSFIRQLVYWNSNIDFKFLDTDGYNLYVAFDNSPNVLSKIDISTLEVQDLLTLENPIRGGYYYRYKNFIVVDTLRFYNLDLNSLTYVQTTNQLQTIEYEIYDAYFFELNDRLYFHIFLHSDYYKVYYGYFSGTSISYNSTSLSPFLSLSKYKDYIFNTNGLSYRNNSYDLYFYDKGITPTSLMYLPSKVTDRRRTIRCENTYKKTFTYDGKIIGYGYGNEIVTLSNINDVFYSLDSEPLDKLTASILSFPDPDLYPYRYYKTILCEGTTTVLIEPSLLTVNPNNYFSGNQGFDLYLNLNIGTEIELVNVAQDYIVLQPSLAIENESNLIDNDITDGIDIFASVTLGINASIFKVGDFKEIIHITYQPFFQLEDIDAYQESPPYYFKSQGFFIFTETNFTYVKKTIGTVVNEELKGFKYDIATGAIVNCETDALTCSSECKLNDTADVVLYALKAESKCGSVCNFDLFELESSSVSNFYYNAVCDASLRNLYLNALTVFEKNLVSNIKLPQIVVDADARNVEYYINSDIVLQLPVVNSFAISDITANLNANLEKLTLQSMSNYMIINEVDIALYNLLVRSKMNNTREIIEILEMK
jgi:hypothetical protein